MRVLVVNAGSSSLKLALLDGGDQTLAARELDAAGARRPRRAASGARRPAGRAPTRSATGSCTAASASARRCAIDADVDAGAARAGRARAAAPAASRCAALDAVDGRAARAAGGRVLRHRLPRHAAAGRRHLRAAARSGASAGRCAAIGFHGLSHAWVARRAARAAGRRRRGPADRQLPPRRGRVAVRDRGRALGRHDDGLHAARGARDGDPLGQRRPRPAAVARRARAAARPRSSPTLSSTAPACSGSPAAPTCARCSPRADGGEPDARLALDVYLSNECGGAGQNRYTNAGQSRSHRRGTGRRERARASSRRRKRGALLGAPGRPRLSFGRRRS